MLLLCLFLAVSSVWSSLTSDMETLLRRYVDTFNANDEELYVEDIPNSQAFSFLRSHIPFFVCPDKLLEEIYYFRWWTFRKHIRTVRLPSGKTMAVITEFMPEVSWTGPGNTICAAAGHHIMEGRWIRGNDSIIDDYSRFWLLGKWKVDPRRYSFWIASALWSRFLVSGDFSLLEELLPKLEQNYRLW